METQEITVRVTPEAAQVYTSASEDRRRKLDALLSIRLREVEQPTRPLDEIMRDASEQARESGLTPAMLRDILDA